MVRANCRKRRLEAPAAGAGILLLALLLAPQPARAGNFYAGTSPANVPWPGGVVPYAFTNTLTPAEQTTYLDGLREWELAANVKFVPHTNQTRWILFAYNTNGFDNVSVGYSPQVVFVASLSRAQVCHEMGHSFGFTHENIRTDATNFINVITNNIYDPVDNLHWFTIDPTSVTNGPYDFESVMHLGWDFESQELGILPTQEPKPPYFNRYEYRMGNLCLSPGDRAALAYLYGPPAVPLTNMVTTTADVGPGSLRAAMYYATDHPGSTVRFNIPTSDPGYSNGVFTIHLTGHLPPLAANGMVIDGSTQPGFVLQPLIFVDGSQILAKTFTANSGLLIYSSSNQVRNLGFSGFNWNSLTLQYSDATNNTISGCWLGVDSTGTNAAPNAYQGILIFDQAGGNTIGGTNPLARNLISGNAQYGVYLTNTAGNQIEGNYIGPDATGAHALPNGSGGLIIRDNAHNNMIGGSIAGARNVISGNTNFGVWIGEPGATGNQVEGNYLGLIAPGTAALPNTFIGMYVLGGATSNRILDNVFSGNPSEGLRLSDPGTSGNVVQGNFFGTDASGSNAVPNGFAGVTIYNGATSNLIGGAAAAVRNLISGNYYGVVLGNSGTSGNSIQGNYVGVDVSGRTAVPNVYGIAVTGGATNNLIGGAVAGAGNLVSGNSQYGVFLTDAGTAGNQVQGNLIGTDLTGTNALGNGTGSFYGANVELQSGATGNLVGGTNAGAGNVIAFSSVKGVLLFDPGTTNNAIRGNFIFGNTNLGIDLNNDGVTSNHVGFLAGPNDFQNYPVITNAYGYAGTTVVAGSLNSLPDQQYFVDIYGSRQADPSGYGQGQFYLGTVPLTTDGLGNGVFACTNLAGNDSGQFITATATSAAGDTSEFSLALLATNRPAPAAEFTGPLAWRAGGFALTLSLATNFTYRVQATTNLAAYPVIWTDLTSHFATNTTLSFTDGAVTSYPTRFYRVVSP